MKFLDLAKVQKIYPDGTRAVHGVDLAVDEGEFVVLLGPSGCGKTTTLRMIAGLEIATGGTIHLGGANVTREPPSRRDVGFVFQFYALYPHLSVRENIAFPLEADGVPWRERIVRVAEVAEAVGVTTLLDARPCQLSGGDQQRVSLARAMVRRPKLWLMDEPLGTLDTAVRASLGAFIHEQQRKHRVTTVFVTHDQDEAMHLADRVVVMEAGHVRQVGTPTEVHDHPASRFVAHFVGSPGMNFLAGQMRGGLMSVAGQELNFPIPIPDGEFVIGVRPNWLRLAESGISGTVVVNEFQGDHRLLHVRVGDARLVARVGTAARLGMGATVHLEIDPQGVRLFDVQTGIAR